MVLLGEKGLFTTEEYDRVEARVISRLDQMGAENRDDRMRAFRSFKKMRGHKE